MENFVTEEAKEWPCRYSKRVLSKKKKKEEGEIEGSQISFFLVLSSRSSSSNTKSCVKRTYILFH